MIGAAYLALNGAHPLQYVVATIYLYNLQYVVPTIYLIYSMLPLQQFDYF